MAEKVAMLGKAMNCSVPVFVHDGQSHPIYFQTFNEHANLGKNMLAMNRIMIMDGMVKGQYVYIYAHTYVYTAYTKFQYLFVLFTTLSRRIYTIIFAQQDSNL